MAEKLCGRIIKSVGGLYTVLTDDGEIQCRARGVFRHSNVSPLVGDIVSVALDDNKNMVISEIQERKNSLIRPPLANLDCVFVTFAAESPAPMLDMTDKLISILEYNNVEPVIIIGKSELNREYADELRAIYSTAGFSSFVISCYDDFGVDEVREFI